MKKITLQVTELEKLKLTKGAKYIFLLDPQYGDMANVVFDELETIGLPSSDFTVLVLPHSKFKAYEITDNPKKESK